MAGIEELIDEVLQMMMESTEDQLKEAVKEVQLSPGDQEKAASKGKAGLKRALRRFLDDEKMEQQPEAGRSLLEKLTTILRPNVVRERESQPELPLETKPANSTTNPSTDQPSGTTQPVWRKEFKVQGQIGDPGQKDKLSFVSLARQINAGLKKGIPEEEIVEAVVRAVCPGLPLRSYLEGRSDLELATLRRVLRSHFREKDATALFHELTNAVQSGKEEAYDFVMRVLDLKQKVLFASQEAGATVTYGLLQVQQMMVRTIGTGLQDNLVQQEMRSSLVPEAADEEVLEVLTTAVARSMERQAKLRTKVRAAAVEANQTDHHENSKKKGAPSPAFNMEELAGSIQAIVRKELQAYGNDRKTAGQTRGSRKRGCLACQEAQKGDTCDHCFRCGGSNHYARGCRQRLQGNEEGLLKGGKQ